MSGQGNCYDNAAPLGILLRKTLPGSGKDVQCFAKQTTRGAASGAFVRKTIPRIVFRTILTA